MFAPCPPLALTLSIPSNTTVRIIGTVFPGGAPPLQTPPKTRKSAASRQPPGPWALGPTGPTVPLGPGPTGPNCPTGPWAQWAQLSSWALGPMGPTVPLGPGPNRPNCPAGPWAQWAQLSRWALGPGPHGGLASGLRIDAIDAEEVKRVAWQYLNDAEIAVTALGPLHGISTIDTY